MDFAQARLLLQRLFVVDIENTKYVAADDVKEAIFPDCMDTCDIVLRSLKEVTQYPNSTKLAHDCTINESKLFLDKYWIVPTGNLLLNMNYLKENFDIFWEKVYLGHKIKNLIRCQGVSCSEIIQNNKIKPCTVKQLKAETCKPIGNPLPDSVTKHVKTGTAMLTVKHCEDNTNELVCVPFVRQATKDTHQYTPLVYLLLMLPEFKNMFQDLVHGHFWQQIGQQIRKNTVKEGRCLTRWFLIHLGWGRIRRTLSVTSGKTIYAIVFPLIVFSPFSSRGGEIATTERMATVAIWFQPSNSNLFEAQSSVHQQPSKDDDGWLAMTSKALLVDVAFILRISKCLAFLPETCNMPNACGDLAKEQQNVMSSNIYMQLFQEKSIICQNSNSNALDFKSTSDEIGFSSRNIQEFTSPLNNVDSEIQRKNSTSPKYRINTHRLLSRGQAGDKLSVPSSFSENMQLLEKPLTENPRTLFQLQTMYKMNNVGIADQKKKIVTNNANNTNGKTSPKYSHTKTNQMQFYTPENRRQKSDRSPNKDPHHTLPINQPDVQRILDQFDSSLSVSGLKPEREKLYSKKSIKHGRRLSKNWYQEKSIARNKPDKGKNTDMEKNVGTNPFMQTINSLKALKKFDKQVLMETRKKLRDVPHELDTIVQDKTERNDPLSWNSMSSPIQSTSVSMLKSRILKTTNQKLKSREFSGAKDVKSNSSECNINNNSVETQLQMGGLTKQSLCSMDNNTLISSSISDGCLRKNLLKKNGKENIRGSNSAPSLPGIYKVDMKGNLKMIFTRVNGTESTSEKKWRQTCISEMEEHFDQELPTGQEQRSGSSLEVKNDLVLEKHNHHKKRWLKQYSKSSTMELSTKDDKPNDVEKADLLANHFHSTSALENRYLCSELLSFEKRDSNSCDYDDHSSLFVSQNPSSEDYDFSGSAYVVSEPGTPSTCSGEREFNIVRRSIRNQGTPKKNYFENLPSFQVEKKNRRKTVKGQINCEKKSKSSRKLNKNVLTLEESNNNIPKSKCILLKEEKNYIFSNPNDKKKDIIDLVKDNISADNWNLAYLNTDCLNWQEAFTEPLDDETEKKFHMTVSYDDEKQGDRNLSLDSMKKDNIYLEQLHSSKDCDTRGIENTKFYKDKEVTDTDGKLLGGYVELESQVIPFTIMNGYKFVTLSDVRNSFSKCSVKCPIVKSCIKNYPGLLRSFCNWEQVQVLESLSVNRKHVVSTGDILVRYDSLIKHMDDIKELVQSQHLNSTKKSSKLCDYF